jgi:hypothetical protein
LIATAVMFCGVLILYLPLTAWQACAVTLLTLAGMGVALYLTRDRVAEATAARS